jgi:hypothetical protein
VPLNGTAKAVPYIPDRGTGTDSSSLSTSESVVMPSDWA